MIAHFEIGILWYLLNTPDSISSTRYIPEAPPLREAETIETGRMKLTKLPLAKSRGVPSAEPPKTPPNAPSYTKRKNAEIKILGSSANGLLINRSTNLFVRI